MSYRMVSTQTGSTLYINKYKKILSILKQEHPNDTDLNLRAIEILEKSFGKILDCEKKSYVGAISIKNADLLNPNMGGLKPQNFVHN